MNPALLPQPGRRIVIIGNTGSGKTTLARRLAAWRNCPHHEMDALHWQPNWEVPAVPEFRRRMDEALRGDCWVTDGNYSKTRDIVWSRADTIVWLDYPLWLILWRLFWRSGRRVLTREELWQGNRETWRGLFWSRDSLLVWAIQNHGRRRRENSHLFQQPEYAHLIVIHLQSPRQTADWLANVQA